jgi:hypothetical protein
MDAFAKKLRDDTPTFLFCERANTYAGRAVQYRGPIALVCGLSTFGCLGAWEPASGDSEHAALACTDARKEMRGRSYDHFRRLSQSELAQTMRALLGDSLFADPGISGRIEGLPPDVTLSAGDFVETPPAGLPVVLLQVARQAASIGLADPAWRAEHLPACAAQALTDECVGTFARDFGGRVWRRPLRDEEVEEYLDFYREAGGGEEGLALLLRRLLQSPSLVFHIEEGSDVVENGRIRLTADEVASRVSYMTVGGMPDEALFAAAREGRLETIEDVRAEVARLLETAEGRAKADEFFLYYTHLDTPADPPEYVAALSGIEDTEGLGAEMRTEALEFWNAIVFERSGTFADLMRSTDAYPRSEALARVFGTQIATEGPVSAPAHPGLFHRPALLLSSSDRTNPIVRGARIRKSFLCDTLGLPDPEIVSAAQQVLEANEDRPNRDAIAEVTSANACRGCHSLVNPLGFLFERYDQLGAVRQEEALFDEAGLVIRSFPIDTHVLAPQIEEGGPAELSDSIALADALAESDKARTCMARRLFEYYRRSAAHVEHDACALGDALIQDREASIRSIIALMIANEDIFWREDPR